MYNMSAAQATRFVEVANEMNERIKELGPSPIKKQKNHESGVRSQESEETEQKKEVM